jgi:hypothetical protein
MRGIDARDVVAFDDPGHDMNRLARRRVNAAGGRAYHVGLPTRFTALALALGA